MTAKALKIERNINRTVTTVILVGLLAIVAIGIAVTVPGCAGKNADGTPVETSPIEQIAATAASAAMTAANEALASGQTRQQVLAAAQAAAITSLMTLLNEDQGVIEARYRPYIQMALLGVNLLMSKSATAQSDNGQKVYDAVYKAVLTAP